MRSRSTVWVPAALALCVLMRGAAGQPATPVDGDAVLKRPVTVNVERQPLADVLADISRQAKVGFVADGPAGADEANISAGPTLDVVLRTLGSAHGLAPAVLAGDLVVCVQRYPRMGALPQCIEGEWALVVRDILAGLPPGAPAASHDVWIGMLQNIGRTLTPSQMADLVAGRTIPLDGLDAERRARAEECLATRQFGPARAALETLAAQLAHLDRGRLQTSGSPTMVHLTVVDRGGRSLTVPVGPIPMVVTIPPSAGAVPANPDTTAAAPAPAASRGINTPVALRMGATTVGAILEEVGRQTGVTVQAPDYMAARRITVTLEGVPARRVLQAIADLQGWVFEAGQEGAFRLARNRTAPGRTRAEVRRAVANALPCDFRMYAKLPPPLDVRQPPAPRMPFSPTPDAYGVRDALLQALSPRLRRGQVDVAELNWPLALVLAAALIAAPMAAAAYWYQSGSYWVSGVCYQSPPADGGGWSYSAGPSSGSVACTSSGEGSHGIAVDFAAWFGWQGPPYPPTGTFTAAAELDGAETVTGGSAKASAGLAYSPYLSVTRNTDDDGDPFDLSPRYGGYSGGGTMVIRAIAFAESHPSGGGTASAQSSSVVWFIMP